MKFTCSVKPGLFVNKGKWTTDVPVDKLLKWLDRQRPPDIESGQVNLYVSNQVRDVQNKIGYFCFLDIESEQHDDIGANIQAARDAYLWLHEQGLTETIEAIATGQGFRFCWPFIISHDHTAAFRDLIQDIPNAEALKDRGFMRLVGYRGNIKQGKSRYLDAHTQLIENPADILTMTADQYHALVSGPLDKAEATEALKKIIPTETPTDNWLLILDEYRRLRKIKNCAIQPPKPDRTGNYLPQIFNELDHRGIFYREIKDGIFRLQECPICGRKDTNPYVTATGRLKCWSINCEAGQRNDMDRIIGLPPHEWIDGLTEPEPEPDAKSPESTATVDQSRELIRSAVNSQQDIAVKVTPGAGKTHTTLMEILQECQNKTVVYAEPTKAKAKELYNTAVSMPEYQFDFNIPAITLIEGRNKKNCQRFDEADKIARKGFRPSLILCPKCLFRNRCKYRKQFRALNRPGLIVMTHEQAALTKAKKADEIVFDENPETTLLKSETVTFDELKHFRVGGGELVKNFFLKIDRLLESQTDQAAQSNQGAVIHNKAPEDQADIFEAAGITPDEIDAMRSRIAYYQPNGETDSQYQKRLYHENVNMRALNWLLITLDEKPGRSNVKISHTGRYYFEFTLLRQVEPTGRVIILDGTAFPDALEKIFRRPFEMIHATVDLSDTKTVHFKRGFGKTKLSRMAQPEIERLLKRSLPELPVTTKRILICTWKDMEPIVKAAAENVFPNHEIKTIHFMETRGLNQFQDHNAAILFGTFTMNPIESGKRAELLFPDDEKTQNQYRLNLSHAENIQSIHRVRPIHGGKTLIVYGRDWLPEIPEPEVVSDLRLGGTDAFEEAYRRAKAFYEQYGFFYRHIGWLLEFGHRTERSQVETLSKVHKKEVFRHINNILLDKTPPNCRLLLLNDRHYYDRIIKRLRRENPAAPIIQTTQTAQNRLATGLGTVKAVRRFLFRLGTLNQFDPAAWDEIRVEPEQVEAETAVDTDMCETTEEFSVSGQRGPPG